MKVKDVKQFVQWMSLLNSLYEHNAVACVWLIKYMLEEKETLESLLLENTHYEVREAFGKLLKTAINITAKNE